MGRKVEFWWRDDDATQPVPALLRLLALAKSAAVPVALAVVPEAATAALCTGLSGAVSLLQHGVDHRNRAAAGERKSEFTDHEPLETALARLARGRGQLQALSEGQSLDVLVPPWNRLSRQLIAQLPRVGLSGLSRYGARDAISAAQGLRQLNTHVDIIAWNAGRGFVGEEAALAQAVRHLAARRNGFADSSEATGWLTHHACHDEAAWRFLGELLDVTRSLPGVRWIDARVFFAGRANA
ncbi:MAG: hypothetical protein EPO27_07340 [Betaproteobacteria bacterium]|nr:MAG: hypothetical protein EPO27_07340 [Betaproteobacteria bacterium]